MQGFFPQLDRFLSFLDKAYASTIKQYGLDLDAARGIIDEVVAKQAKQQRNGVALARYGGSPGLFPGGSAPPTASGAAAASSSVGGDHDLLSGSAGLADHPVLLTVSGEFLKNLGFDMGLIQTALDVLINKLIPRLPERFRQGG